MNYLRVNAEYGNSIQRCVIMTIKEEKMVERENDR